MKEIVQIILLLLLMPFAVAWRGYILTIMWSWFITPVFGLSGLRIPYAIGLSCITSYLTYQDIDCAKNDDNTNAFTKSLIKSFGLPLFFLFFCWIVKFWI